MDIKPVLSALFENSAIFFHTASENNGIYIVCDPAFEATPAFAAIQQKLQAANLTDGSYKAIPQDHKGKYVSALQFEELIACSSEEAPFLMLLASAPNYPVDKAQWTKWKAALA